MLPIRFYQPPRWVVPPMPSLGQYNTATATTVATFPWRGPWSTQQGAPQ